MTSDLFPLMVDGGYEQVVFCHDPATGLRSLIVIHNTTLGPGLGGVRMWPYATEAEALEDALRLARGMTWKAAGAGVRLGGAKSVIIGDPQRDKTPELLRAHGRFIQSLSGRYIPGIDVGTSMDDLRVIGQEAERVSCVREDPSPMTALGVLESIRACMVHLGRGSSLQESHVVVQGAGHVGEALIAMLRAEGARVTLSDFNAERAIQVAARHGADVVSTEAAYDEPCDVFAPCALGAVLNPRTIPRLRCAVVAGSANNQLADPADGEALHRAGVLYAPDFVANAGGLILLEEEILGHDVDHARARVREVGNAVTRVLRLSDERGITPGEAADVIAQERLGNAAASPRSLTRL